MRQQLRVQEHAAVMQVSRRGEEVVSDVVGPDRGDRSQVGEDGAIVLPAERDTHPRLERRIHGHEPRVDAALLQPPQDQAAEVVVAHAPQDPDAQPQLRRLAGEDAARSAHLHGIVV